MVRAGDGTFTSKLEDVSPVANSQGNGSYRKGPGTRRAQYQ